MHPRPRDEPGARVAPLRDAVAAVRDETMAVDLFRRARRQRRERSATRLLPAFIVLLSAAVLGQAEWWLVAGLGSLSLGAWLATPMPTAD
jgi:hypothetical protein